MSNKVYIGVGHGGSDPGAVANGLKEADCNLEVAKACMNYLANYCTVKISRTKDVDSTITSKVKEANNWDADCVIEIHHNSGGGDGAEIYYPHDGPRSKVLAQNVLDSIVSIGQNSRGVKTKTTSSGSDYFGVLRDTTMPSILVECAFLDSKDKNIIDTPAERKTMGEAIAKGVLKWLGINPTVAPAKLLEKPSDILKKGDKGIAVYSMKQMLRLVKDKGKIKAGVDNDDIFGAGTETALKEVQKLSGIGQDGKFGTKTADAMYKLLK